MFNLVVTRSEEMGGYSPTDQNSESGLGYDSVPLNSINARWYQRSVPKTTPKWY